MSETQVLVVDDEAPIRRALLRALTGHGYRVQLADDGATALDLLAMQRVDLVVLDLMMPGVDGFEVLRQVRTWSHVPILVLTARGDEVDKVAALDLGADDYLTKPFGIEELLARLRALRRRAGTQNEDQPLVQVGEIEIDLARRLVRRQDEVVRLTPTEYALLATLAKQQGRLLTHRQLIEAVWGAYSLSYSGQLKQQQQLRVYIAYLRRKLEANPAKPQLILTDPGMGYRFATT